MAHDEKRAIFAIGGSGLIGSRMQELLRDTYQITSVSTRSGVDITRPETLSRIANDVDHSTVLHLAAKADVDGCEKDKLLGENGDAWRVNVIGTRNVIDACRKNNKKIVYISTDFVFDGTKSPDDAYSEDDTPNPLNWYAETKYRGEQLVVHSGLPYLIVRVAYPYGNPKAEKKDFFSIMTERLKNNKPLKAVTDHLFTPTFIDDIAFAIQSLLDRQAIGTYHVVGSQTLTPYHAAVLISQSYGFDAANIQPVSRADFFQGRAVRPFNLSLKNDKIQSLGVSMRTFEDALSSLKE